MIDKAMQTITAIVIPIVSTGYVLSAADNHQFGSGAPASSRPSHVALLSCEPDANNPYYCLQPPPRAIDGCPPVELDPREHDFCEDEQVGQSRLTPGPTIPEFKPKPSPIVGPEIIEYMPK
jgi:hypothetical protein